MHLSLKIVLALFALLFLSMGGMWLFAPAMAAQNLNMPLLEGSGLSTQIGDLGAFFVSLGVMILAGIFRLNKTWLHAASLLLLGTGVGRTLAWQMHGASLETQAIGLEIIAGALCLFAASRINSAATTGS